MGFPGGASGKEPSLGAGDLRDKGAIPGSGKAPGGGHGNTFQYSWLGIPWTEEPGQPHFMYRKESDMTEAT